MKLPSGILLVPRRLYGNLSLKRKCFSSWTQTTSYASREDIQVVQNYTRPANFLSIRGIKDRYEQATDEELLIYNNRISVAGRVSTIREAGSKLRFVDITSDGSKFQVVMRTSDMVVPSDITTFKRGDLIEVEGVVGRTSAGQLSLYVSRIRVLASCQSNIPDVHAPTMTEENQWRNRHLHLISDRSALALFRERSRIMARVRNYLSDMGFIEVETPILATKFGGASANPFHTSIDSMDLSLCMRISPELYLKNLIVGGFEKVFELGKVFRNEGIDSTHNPEFTSLEFYQAYACMHDMMKLLEEMLLYAGEGRLFESPFRRIEIIPALEELANSRFDLEDPLQQQSTCLQIIRENRIVFDESNMSLSHLYDKLIGHFLEPLCQEPTFLMNHPISCSPLAARHPSNPYLSSRFELFFRGKELANGYSELNDPADQEQRFMQQLSEKAQGNSEAQIPDADFVDVLKAGMPPTGGCGIGMDRLIMFLTGRNHIRDVLLFPLMRPKQ